MLTWSNSTIANPSSTVDQDPGLSSRIFRNTCFKGDRTNAIDVSYNINVTSRTGIFRYNSAKDQSSDRVNSSN